MSKKYIYIGAALVAYIWWKKSNTTTTASA